MRSLPAIALLALVSTQALRFTDTATLVCERGQESQALSISADDPTQTYVVATLDASAIDPFCLELVVMDAAGGGSSRTSLWRRCFRPGYISIGSTAAKIPAVIGSPGRSIAIIASKPDLDSGRILVLARLALVYSPNPDAGGHR